MELTGEEGEGRGGGGPELWVTRAAQAKGIYVPFNLNPGGFGYVVGEDTAMQPVVEVRWSFLVEAVK